MLFFYSRIAFPVVNGRRHCHLRLTDVLRGGSIDGFIGSDSSTVSLAPGLPKATIPTPATKAFPGILCLLNWAGLGSRRNMPAVIQSTQRSGLAGEKSSPFAGVLYVSLSP